MKDILGILTVDIFFIWTNFRITDNSKDWQVELTTKSFCTIFIVNYNEEVWIKWDSKWISLWLEMNGYAIILKKLCECIDMFGLEIGRYDEYGLIVIRFEVLFSLLDKVVEIVIGLSESMIGLRREIGNGANFIWSLIVHFFLIIRIFWYRTFFISFFKLNFLELLYSHF